MGPSKRGKRPGKQAQGQQQQQTQQQTQQHHISSEEWSMMDLDSEDLDDEEENFLVCWFCKPACVPGTSILVDTCTRNSILSKEQPAGSLYPL